MSNIKWRNCYAILSSFSITLHAVCLTRRTSSAGYGLLFPDDVVKSSAASSKNVISAVPPHGRAAAIPQTIIFCCVSGLQRSGRRFSGRQKDKGQPRRPLSKLVPLAIHSVLPKSLREARAFTLPTAIACCLGLALGTLEPLSASRAVKELPRSLHQL